MNLPFLSSYYRSLPFLVPLRAYIMFYSNLNLGQLVYCCLLLTEFEFSPTCLITYLHELFMVYRLSYTVSLFVSEKLIYMLCNFSGNMYNMNQPAQMQQMPPQMMQVQHRCISTNSKVRLKIESRFEWCRLCCITIEFQFMVPYQQVFMVKLIIMRATIPDWAFNDFLILFATALNRE